MISPEGNPVPWETGSIIGFADPGIPNSFPGSFRTGQLGCGSLNDFKGRLTQGFVRYGQRRKNFPGKGVRKGKSPKIPD